MSTSDTPCRAIGRNRTETCANYPACWCATSASEPDFAEFREVLKPLGLPEAHERAAFVGYRLLVLNIDHGLTASWLRENVPLPASVRDRVLALLVSLGVASCDQRGRWAVTRCLPASGGDAL